MYPKSPPWYLDMPGTQVKISSVHTKTLKTLATLSTDFKVLNRDGY